MRRLIAAGIILLIVGSLTYFISNYELAGLRVERSVLLEPNQSISFSVPFSEFYFGFYPGNLSFHVDGGRVVNSVPAVIPYNGTSLNTTAYEVLSYGTSAQVSIVNDLGRPVNVVYAYKESGASYAILAILNLFGILLVLFGVVAFVLGLLVRRVSDEGTAKRSE
ncbi:MAG: hypothetical protein NO076_04020 [Sulfolobales archaeon]|jgi:hypothetical protein|nr:hypothetical protein [Sulfolobales archaeon]MDT7906014.1 hypothetical protein [Sulfolobales archaeon]